MKQQEALEIVKSAIKKRKNINYIISIVTFLVVVLLLSIAQNYESYIASAVIYAALITYEKNSENIKLSEIDSSTDKFRTFWIVIYWVIFFLSNLVYTLQSFFHNNGYIDFKKKIRAAFRELIIFYKQQFIKLVIICITLFIVLSIICLFWFKIKGFDNILAVIVVISNVYGISILAFLFGYGLVKIPFYLWSKSSRDDYLVELLCKSHELFKEYQSSYWKYLDICYVSKNYQSKIANVPIYSDYLKLIKKETPDLNEPIGYRFKKNILYKPDSKITELVIKLKTNGQINEDVLANLRQEIRERQFNYERFVQKWKRISSNAFSIIAKESLEEMNQNLNATRSTSQSIIGKNSTKSKEDDIFNVKPVKIKAEQMNILTNIAFKIAAVVTALFSLLIIFCEATIVFGSQNKALAFYQMIKDTQNIPGIITLILLVLLYVIFCTYFALGKLKVFGSFELFIYFTHRDVFIQNLQMCLFLTFPLCYNVMLLFGIIDQKTEGDGKIYQSGFDKFYDPMKEIPFFGFYYNAIVCFLIFVITIVSSFKKTQKIIQKISQNKIQMQVDVEQELILKGEFYILQEWQRRKQAEQIQEIQDSTEQEIPEDQQQQDNLGQNIHISVSQFKENENQPEEQKKINENVFRKVSNFFKRISFSSKKDNTNNQLDTNQNEKASNNQDLNLQNQSVSNKNINESQSCNISIDLSSSNDIQNSNFNKIKKNFTKK